MIYACQACHHPMPEGFRRFHPLGTCPPKPLRLGLEWTATWFEDMQPIEVNPGALGITLEVLAEAIERWIYSPSVAELETAQ